MPYGSKRQSAGQTKAHRHDQMLNQGVTQTYLIVKTSRSKILMGSEIIRIRKMYIVIELQEAHALVHLSRKFRAHADPVHQKCGHDEKQHRRENPENTRAQIAA